MVLQFLVVTLLEHGAYKLLRVVLLCIALVRCAETVYHTDSLKVTAAHAIASDRFVRESFHGRTVHASISIQLDSTSVFQA